MHETRLTLNHSEVKLTNLIEFFVNNHQHENDIVLRRAISLIINYNHSYFCGKIVFSILINNFKQNFSYHSHKQDNPS